MRLLWLLGLAVLFGCKTQQHTESMSVKEMYGVQVIEHKDSLHAQLDVAAERLVVTESQSDLWGERVYWSKPDSTGEQYPVMTERWGNKATTVESQASSTSTHADVEQVREAKDSISAAAKTIEVSKKDVEVNDVMDDVGWVVVLIALFLIGCFRKS